MSVFTAKKASPPIRDLRDFLSILEKENELIVIEKEVDPYLEIAEIHRRVVALNGKALYFKNVKGKSFPVVTNIFGSEKRINLAFSERPEKFIETMCHFATEHFPPKLSSLWEKRKELSSLLRLGTKKIRRGKVSECRQSSVNLDAIPMTHSWEEDGGCFVTLPLIYTEHPSTKVPNLGMYRIQRHDSKTTGLHWQIGKGGGFHYAEAERQGLALDVSIFIGGPPSLIVAAIAPLPENVPELLIASLLSNSKIEVEKRNDFSHPLISSCEFALQGKCHPFVRKLEGPFGDHYGYYSLAHEFPVFECSNVYHRKDAIFPATVVGKPLQEDLYIGNYLQKLFSLLFPIVMPQVRDLHTFSEAGFHCLAAAKILERFEKESLTAAFRILGEGQLSLTKVLFITDHDIDIRNAKELIEMTLATFQPECDLKIFTKTALDTLDYSGPKLNRGSKAVFFATGKKKRDLPHFFSGNLPSCIRQALTFCPGCLVIDGLSYDKNQSLDFLLENVDLQAFPLVILTDDAKKTVESQLEFLWTTFTRFDPASDIYAKKTVLGHHISYSFPIIIDARMKPHYPKELASTASIKEYVDKHWEEYFSN